MADKKRGALSKSMKKGADEEEERSRDRFAKADEALGSASGGYGERSKVIRDTFSFPPQEHAQLKAIMDRWPALSRRFTRSEIVRAGLAVLADMDDDELAEALDRIERLKTGRPS